MPEFIQNLLPWLNPFVAGASAFLNIFLVGLKPIQGLDITLVVLLMYWTYRLVNRSRAVWLVRGFLIIVGAYFLSSLAGLSLLNLILDKVLIGVAVAIPVIFQPELRQVLEQLGRGVFLTKLFPNAPARNREEQTVTSLLEAVELLTAQRIGALIVLEQTAIDERLFSDAGTLLDAEVSAELLVTIFFPKTPLHDGAVVIRDNKIWAAGVILPITEQSTSKQLGTRHRAALGITEQSSSHCIVVSEETGGISYAVAGRLQRSLTLEELKGLLVQTESASLPPLPDWFKLPGKPTS